MSRLVIGINEPPERGTFVLLRLMEIAEHYAPLVEVVVRRTSTATRSPTAATRHSGQTGLEDPEAPEVELFARGHAMWVVLDQHYCETVLILHPCEPGERVFTLESDSYEACLKDTMRLRLQDRHKKLRLIKKEEQG